MTTSHNSDSGTLLSALGTVLNATHTALSICAVIFLLSLVVLDYFSISLIDRGTESKYRKVFDSGVTSFQKTSPSTSALVEHPGTLSDGQHIGAMRGSVMNIQGTSQLEAELAYIAAEFKKLQIRHENLRSIIADRYDKASQTDANTIVMMDPDISR